MFIAADDGSFINSDDVARITNAKVKNTYGLYPVYAVLRDGRTVNLEGGMEEVIRRLTPVIPAASGFEALLTWWDDEDRVLRVQRQPVLGWRDDPLMGMSPVVLDDQEVCMNVSLSGVKYPDGQVVCVADAVYEDEAKWFADMQRQELKRRAGKIGLAGA